MSTCLFPMILHFSPKSITEQGTISLFDGFFTRTVSLFHGFLTV
jgi:hypothetical protein